MLGFINHPLLAVAWLLAQEKTQSALQRMSPQQRAKVLAAFAAFLILGFGMVALAWVGARVTRRYMNQGPLRRLDPTLMQDDWASKPLVRPPKKLPPAPPELDSEER
jgi:hypothetical protein